MQHGQGDKTKGMKQRGGIYQASRSVVARKIRLENEKTCDWKGICELTSNGGCEEE